jgi:hypothetical protein
MRMQRSLLAAIGAAISIVAAVACTFLATSGVVAFNRWPGGVGAANAQLAVQPLGGGALRVVVPAPAPLVVAPAAIAAGVPGGAPAGGGPIGGGGPQGTAAGNPPGGSPGGPTPCACPASSPNLLDAVSHTASQTTATAGQALSGVTGAAGGAVGSLSPQAGRVASGTGQSAGDTVTGTGHALGGH